MEGETGTPSIYGKNSKESTNSCFDLPSLDASGIAEFIRFDCCPRYFKLRFEDDEEKKKAWPEAFHKPLSPLLYAAGKQLEEKTVQELRNKAANYQDFSCYDPKTNTWQNAWPKSLQDLKAILMKALSSEANAEYKPVLIYQAPMMGHIGMWDVKGIADLIGVWPLKDGKIKVRIFEIKSSWKEQTAHRIQVAIYVLLLSEALGNLASNVDFEGGVINKESDLINLDPNSLPSFKLDPLIQDVQRLLSTSGELYRIHNRTLAQVDYHLSWRCDNCGFNECCVVRAVESESIALLNLTRGEQKALRQHGIHRLEDLAKLKAVPKPDELRPYNFNEVAALEPQKVQLLTADPVIGAKLDRLIQRAQYMLLGIRPTSQHTNKVRNMPWLSGTGYGTLPEDSPQDGADTGLLFKPDGMIRIYFHVQWDYLLNIISMISARVSCTRCRGEPISLSRTIANLAKEQKECLTEEKNLLEAFFIDLTRAINEVAKEIGSPDEAPIHLYFFSRQERDHLMDAVRRNSSLMTARAVQDLLGLRQAIDQPMFSILQDEVLLRKAVGYHSTGILPILKQCNLYENYQWTTKRKDGSSLDLRRVFYDGFFNFELPYTRNSDGTMSFLLGSEDTRKKESYYPARARFGNQIPIEYIWAAKNRLDSTQVKRLEKVMVEKRMWCDYPIKTRRITEEDLMALGSKLCLALEQLERSLTIRNRRLGKKPIAIPKIPQFTLGHATLERSCREFLDLEHFARRQQLYQHYALLPCQRVATGRSVIFECTNVEETDEDFTVKGKLVYEGLGIAKSECTINACRVKGSDDSGSGDWMVATEIRLNNQGQYEETQQRSPSGVEKSARVIVEKVDLRKMELTLKIVSWPTGKSRRYSAWHNLPTTDKNKAMNSKHLQLFEKGRTYILDELADDIISERAAKCLDYSADNAMYNLLQDFLAGKNKPSERTQLPKDLAAKFLDWTNNTNHPPKPEQSRFIERIFGKEQIVMLQGPPGTGKTETLQLAVLAHIAAHSQTAKCRVLMVAPTHKAIQEFVSKLAKSWKNFCNTGKQDLANLRIYRVVNSTTASVRQRIDGITYVNYNENEEVVNEIKDALMSQEKLVHTEADNFPLVLCVTPPGLYGLMKKIGGKEPAWDEGYFDLLVVDEASMMRLPELILSGAFIEKNAQILVAGDHRQLPPIQSHNWEKEDRRTIEEMASFLSGMDFLRLLRQEDLGLEHIKSPQKADIPTERLSETHRCHQVVAKFLRDWVYNKDGIDFRSDQTQMLSSDEPSTEGLKVVLEPKNILALVVHDEQESFQSNLVEAKIIEAIVGSVKSESIGIVTPHNAQRGVVTNLMLDGCDNMRVDTVERFQGGEADCIIISSTVSDPDYVRMESDFLLNLNRINVAVSRMKKKLVIVASRSIFEFMPQEAKDYDKALLWKGLAQTVGFTADANPKWKGSLSEFLGKTAQKVDVEIYVKGV
ncbi:MAG TPA: AAA domain-containing protein [Candidatus Nanoarchaeia archaeon]|nr:AAA domain-containing protein [Candidatus Nanoarchaeia archaeon]